MSKKLDKLQKKATALTAKGNFAKAIKLYQEMYWESPQDIRIWLKIADLYRNLDDTENALTFYQKAAALYALQGKLIQAIGINKIILDIEPDHIQTQEALADLYARRDANEPKIATAEPASTAALKMLKRRGPVLKFERELEAEQKPVSGPTLNVEEAKAKLPDTAEPRDPVEDIDQMLDFFEQSALDTIPDKEPHPALPEIPLFSTLDHAEFVGIVESANRLVFQDGESVIQEGEEGDSIFIIISGSAVVSKLRTNDQRLVLATLGEGAFFGELSYFRGAPRSASVHAKGELQLLELTRARIDDLVVRFPDIKRRLMDYYHQRMLDTVLHISPLFVYLSEEERQQAREQLEYVETTSGEHMIEQSRPAPGLYVIARGRVEASSTSKEGEAITYPAMTDGDFFGEISLISGKNATATCVVTEPTALYRMSRDGFVKLRKGIPAFAVAAEKFAAERTRRSKDLLAAAREKGMSANGLI